MSGEYTCWTCGKRLVCERCGQNVPVVYVRPGEEEGDVCSDCYDAILKEQKQLGMEE